MPAGSSLSLKTVNGRVQVQGVSGELDIESTNGGVTLDQAGSSIVAHTLNGPITANVARLDTGKPSSFSTMNGRIDLTLPVAVHANLTMRSDRGDIYLDQGFDFKPLPNPSGSTTKSESNGMTNLRMDNTIRGTINGGGAENRYSHLQRCRPGPQRQIEMASSELAVWQTEILETENRFLRAERRPRCIAEAPAMQPVLEMMARIGPSDAKVLITGEPGTGKEIVAQTLHALSSRCNRSLVAVNAGALPEGTFEK